MTETSISIVNNGVRPSFKSGKDAMSKAQNFVRCIDIKKYIREEYKAEDLNRIKGLLKRNVKSYDWFLTRLDYIVDVKIKSHKRIYNIHTMIMNNEYDKALVELFR